MAIAVQQARPGTPGGGAILHFNKAGATLMPRPGLDARSPICNWKLWLASMKQRRHS
jgi:hypothetical protein